MNLCNDIRVLLDRLKRSLGANPSFAKITTALQTLIPRWSAEYKWVIDTLVSKGVQVINMFGKKQLP